MRFAPLLLLPFLLPGPLLYGQQNQARSARPVIFIVDASGSMAEKMGGVTRMQAARLILRQHLKRFDKSTPLGLVAYGNKIPGCRSHRLYSRVRSDNQSTIAAQVDKMQAAGATPLSGTLKLVEQTILPQHPDANVVIISDGAESCGGDPARIARRLREKYPGLNINVIGLQVKRDARSQLESLANAGHGAYFQVDSPRQFAAALQGSTGVRGSRPAGRIGGWREPEEPYIATEAVPVEEPRNTMSDTPRDPHESLPQYNHPARDGAKDES